MNTIDDVIKAWKLCEGNPETCQACPYRFVSVKTEDCYKDDALYYLQDYQRIAVKYLENLKAKTEEPPLGKAPDYISLGFHDLAEMVGTPVYVKDHGCKGHWEIVTAVRKTIDSEDVCFRGSDRWQRIGNNIYCTKEGADKNE